MITAYKLYDTTEHMQVIVFTFNNGTAYKLKGGVGDFVFMPDYNLNIKINLLGMNVFCIQGVCDNNFYLELKIGPNFPSCLRVMISCE